MKKLIYAVMAVLCSLTALSQTDTTFYKRYNVELGVRVPLGNLAAKMGTSPELGFWYRTRIEHNDMLDFGITLYLPQKRERFDYVAPDSLYRVKAEGVSGMVGMRFCKVLKLPGRYDKSLEWVTSYGWAFFTYHDTPAELHDERNPDPEPRAEGEIVMNTHTKSFSTFHVGQGLRFNFHNFGLLAQYSYSPYGIFSDHVPKDFGSHSLSLSLIYQQ